MQLEFVRGDLLDQNVDVIINAWNRNIIPWWLLLPGGVSGAIKRRGGIKPFRELARFGPMPLGSARITGAGRLPFKAIIHVAGINMFWAASEFSIRTSVENAMRLVKDCAFASVAFPIIGAGHGRFNEERALFIMRATFDSIEYTGEVILVRYQK